MGSGERFDRYMDHLSAGLGHLDRHAELKGYCTGLMLPLARKGVGSSMTQGSRSAKLLL
jgi:SRSO17 transposase